MDDMAALILMKHMRAASRQQGIKEKLAIHIVCLIVKAHFLDAALTIKKSLETISCLKAFGYYFSVIAKRMMIILLA